MIQAFGLEAIRQAATAAGLPAERVIPAPLSDNITLRARASNIGAPGTLPAHGPKARHHQGRKGQSRPDNQVGTL